MTRCATCCLERHGPFPRATASLRRRRFSLPRDAWPPWGPTFGGGDAPARDLRAIRAAADQPTHEESARGQEGERRSSRPPADDAAVGHPPHPASARSRTLAPGYRRGSSTRLGYQPPRVESGGMPPQSVTSFSEVRSPGLRRAAPSSLEALSRPGPKSGCPRARPSRARQAREIGSERIQAARAWPTA
jgi:hypothetical protein